MDEELLDELTKNACYAADRVALRDGYQMRASTTSAIVKEALRLLLGNGLVTAVPLDRWPAYVVLDPPYDPSFFGANHASGS